MVICACVADTIEAQRWSCTLESPLNPHMIICAYDHRSQCQGVVKKIWVWIYQHVGIRPRVEAPAVPGLLDRHPCLGIQALSQFPSRHKIYASRQKIAPAGSNWKSVCFGGVDTHALSPLPTMVSAHARPPPRTTSNHHRSISSHTYSEFREVPSGSGVRILLTRGRFGGKYALFTAKSATCK